jgi:hypothetical protein
MLEEIIEQAEVNGSEFLSPAPKSRLTSVEIAGIGIARNIKNEEQKTWRTRMTALLQELNDKGVGLLIEVDEINSEPEMLKLSTTFQHFVTEKRNVALLMAGLPSNVMQLLQHENTTFLRRSFQQELVPLSTKEVEFALRKTIEASGRTINKDALGTASVSANGFPFLMQLNGYHIWRQSPDKKRISLQDAKEGIAAAKDDMDRMILKTTLQELTRREVDFLAALAKGGQTSRVGQVAHRMGASPSLATRYKKRLLGLGLIEEEAFGELAFQMPLLREYVLEHCLERQ